MRSRGYRTGTTSVHGNSVASVGRSESRREVVGTGIKGSVICFSDVSTTIRKLRGGCTVLDFIDIAYN